MAIKNEYNTRLIEGTKAELEASNTIYDDNVFLRETDTLKLKMGDGENTYSSLKYIGESAPVDISGKVNKSGDTMTGKLTFDDGIDFKDLIADSPTDLSKHIKLHSNNWGISILSGNFNFVSDQASTNVFNFYQADTKIATVAKTITNNTHLTTKKYVDDGLKTKLTATQADAQADSTATDISGLVDDFNALLAKLRAANIIKT